MQTRVAKGECIHANGPGSEPGFAHAPAPAKKRAPRQRWLALPRNAPTLTFYPKVLHPSRNLNTCHLLFHSLNRLLFSSSFSSLLLPLSSTFKRQLAVAWLQYYTEVSKLGSIYIPRICEKLATLQPILNGGHAYHVTHLLGINDVRNANVTCSSCS